MGDGGVTVMVMVMVMVMGVIIKSPKGVSEQNIYCTNSARRPCFA